MVGCWLGDGSGMAHPRLVASLLQALLSHGDLSEIPCVMVHLWASTEPQVTPEEVRAGKMKVLGKIQQPSQTRVPTNSAVYSWTKIIQSFESIGGLETEFLGRSKK